MDEIEIIKVRNDKRAEYGSSKSLEDIKSLFRRVVWISQVPPSIKATHTNISVTSLCLSEYNGSDIRVGYMSYYRALHP